MQFRLWAPLITQAKLVREIKDDFIRQATDAGIRAGDAKGLTRSEGLALATKVRVDSKSRTEPA